MNTWWKDTKTMTTKYIYPAFWTFNFSSFFLHHSSFSSNAS